MLVSCRLLYFEGKRNGLSLWKRICIFCMRSPFFQHVLTEGVLLVVSFDTQLLFSFYFLLFFFPPTKAHFNVCFSGLKSNHLFFFPFTLSDLSQKCEVMSCFSQWCQMNSWLFWDWRFFKRVFLIFLQVKNNSNRHTHTLHMDSCLHKSHILCSVWNAVLLFVWIQRKSLKFM